MKIQLIRNATMKFYYGRLCVLTDPYLAPKHTLPPYAGKSANPCVDLPIPLSDVLSGVQMTLLSHAHGDHFDKTAQDALPKDRRLYCQPSDAESIHQLGFSNVRPVEDEVDWEGINIVRTSGKHGSGEVLDEMGAVSGYVISKAAEPVIYWVGDSILSEEVRQTVDRYRPDVIITHSCGAVWGKDKTLIVMDAAQTIDLCKYAPMSQIIAIHMEAVDHATVTRTNLAIERGKADIAKERLLIPRDGEIIEL
jgi:L-ascorbate metabolism protein UlaG (beta-lactamase superfamily)